MWNYLEQKCYNSLNSIPHNYKLEKYIYLQHAGWSNGKTLFKQRSSFN